MRLTKNYLLLVAGLYLFTVFGGVSHGQIEYHVSVNGDDTGPGTAALPFRTLKKPLELATTGLLGQVTVKIASGTYNKEGVDQRATFTRPGTGQNTYLRIEGGYNEAFTVANGVSIFLPDDVGFLDAGLEVNLARQQELEISRLQIQNTGGRGLVVNSVPSGNTLLTQTSASVKIAECDFSGNRTGAIVDMPIGPDGTAAATTTLSVDSSSIDLNVDSGLIVSGVTSFSLVSTTVRENGAPSGGGLVLASTSLREGLISDSAITENGLGISLVNVGTSPLAAGEPGLRIRSSNLTSNASGSSVENTRRLVLELDPASANPCVIQDRAITTTVGALQISDLQIVPIGVFGADRAIVFENVRGVSPFRYYVQGTETALGPLLNPVVTDAEASVELHGTDEGDTIAATGGNTTTAILTVGQDLDPGLIATRVLVTGAASLTTAVQIICGTGDDVVMVTGSRYPLFVSGGAGIDTLAFEDNPAVALADAGHVHLFGGPGDDTLTADTRSGLQRVTLEGGQGANDKATGGEGDELFVFRLGDGNYSTLAGGGGSDVFRYVIDQDIGTDLLVRFVGGNELIQGVGAPLTPAMVESPQIRHIEVVTEAFPNPVVVGPPAIWVESISIIAKELPLNVRLDAFTPTTPGGNAQEVFVLGAPGFEADSSLEVVGFEASATSFDTEHGGDGQPGRIEVWTGASTTLPILANGLSEVTLRGQGPTDVFTARFWPETELIVLGGAGTDTLTVPASEEPYSESVDGDFTVLSRAGFADIRFDELEVVNINPTNPALLPGDVTGDGIVNVADVTMLANHLFYAGPLTAPSNADVNDDGDVDADDLDALVESIVN